MPQDRVEAVDRAISILHAFNEVDTTLGLSQIAERTGLYKSTVLRLIGSLKAAGFISIGADGKYSIGPDLWRLGGCYRARYPSGDLIVPILERLQDETGESASFYVIDGDYRVCLFRVNSTRPMRHHLEQGARLPLNQGAAGHVLRAYSDHEDKGAVETRLNGHAISLGERDSEIAAAAAPLFGKDDVFLGALAVSGLITRFTDENCQRHLNALLRAKADLAEP